MFIQKIHPVHEVQLYKCIVCAGSTYRRAIVVTTLVRVNTSTKQGCLPQLQSLIIVCLQLQIFDVLENVPRCCSTANNRHVIQDKGSASWKRRWNGRLGPSIGSCARIYTVRTVKMPENFKLYFSAHWHSSVTRCNTNRTISFSVLRLPERFLLSPLFHMTIVDRARETYATEARILRSLGFFERKQNIGASADRSATQQEQCMHAILLVTFTKLRTRLLTAVHMPYILLLQRKIVKGQVTKGSSETSCHFQPCTCRHHRHREPGITLHWLKTSLGALHFYILPKASLATLAWDLDTDSE